VLIEAESGYINRFPVPYIERLDPQDAYDLVLVIVRKNQIPSVLPDLAVSQRTPNVLFLNNNAAGPHEMVDALGRERVLIGFPGGGGQRDEGIVRYMLSPRNAQPTTIGELDGSHSPRVQAIAALLESAGLPVAISSNMDAWLKTHVALISPIANAIYLADGSSYRLARTRDGIVLMVRAVREGLRVLRALDIPVTPPRMRILDYIPEPVLVAVLERRLPTPAFELAAVRHANAARDEMTQIAIEFRDLARRSGVSTPAIDILDCYLDPKAEPLPIGQSTLALEWKQAMGELGVAAALLLAILWLAKRGRK
jgi:2-dehydropantoate 2-reductase